MGLDRDPVVVIWEVTRACALKCAHCRAEAADHRDPRELSVVEARSLLREIRRFESPVVVFTGGDPLRRPDLTELVEYGVSLGLRVAVTPSATPGTGFDELRGLKEAGTARLAVSLDGASPAVHDGFRGVEGSFERTKSLMRWANELGLPLQINTTVSRHDLDDFDAIARLLEDFGVALWSVFFLVPVGRAGVSQLPKGSDFEAVFNRMVDVSLRGRFPVKSTEAPQYRRVLIQRLRRRAAEAGSMRGVNDGKGFVFVSHTGDIYPSGFLPVPAGNVRRDSLVRTYRESPIFRTLRDVSVLKGKCGACEYKTVCGGSRARAYALTGDLTAPDPFCVHVPQGYEVGREETKYW